MNELALFAGAGGGILGGKLLGWRTICAVEWEPYPASVLVARQNEGVLPPFPIWDDVQTFNGKPWRGRVDVISGGFPCQDISCAGKGAGIDGERSGMWGHMARIIGEVLPRFVYVENSPMLVGRGLGRVISDLAKMGYDAEWGIVGAHHVSAPHKRDRIWIMAHAEGCDDRLSDSGEIERQAQESGEGSGGADLADSMRERGAAGLSEQEQWKKRNSEEFNDCGNGCGEFPDSSVERLQGETWEGRAGEEGESNGHASECGWWAVEPDVGRVAHGVAARVDRLKAIGNGQVPAVAARAWEILNSK